ncbi:glycosyltransferase family 2 protein [Pseudonocardiaceae bacterium YIM PH 21723]|nr:glycosyltransferase family 2 protein [Pseudonocardiaceae bacterium YIM PH 21723]
MGGVRVASVAVILLSLALAVVAVLTLWWTLHAWRTPEVLRGTRFEAPLASRTVRFSLLVPARHEQAVLEQTITQLLRSTHDDYEIIIIVGHDDPETAEVAERLATRYPALVSVITDHNPVKNKPKALNTALPHCKGDVVGVFDAEDQVHPALLAHVDHAFSTTNAAVVQGGVQLINFHSSWYSLRNCLEYYFYFRSRLHLQAQQGFIPLGGNTVFIRTETLRRTGGWDPECLAEDCDLGVRLSSQGYRVVVAYDSLLVTREETPDTLMSLFKQRTRWNQGFLQVFRKKEWRKLPTFRQRALARFTLMSPFFQAYTGLLIPLGIGTALLLELPAAVALVTFLPLIPTVANLAFEVAGLHDFGKQYELNVRPAHYLKLVVGAPLYMMLLAGAATRAIYREGVGARNWELTRHVGAHLHPEQVTS